MAFAATLGGCASVPPTELPTVPVVTLPLARAGITDARRDFARVFEQALGADQGPAATWLHGIDAAATASPTAATERRSRFAARAASTVVLVVPGLFGHCVQSQSVPFGDGLVRSAERSRTEAYRQYDDLGLHTIRLAALPGRGRVGDNGRELAAQIRAEAARAGVERIVLIGYSKGVADAMQALVLLHAEGGVPPQVTALVSVAGLVMGSTLAERYDGLYEALAPKGAFLDCSPSDGHELTDLSHAQRVAWLASNPLPTGLRYYSVVAFASSAETAPALRALRASLAAIDARNDGQIVARDAIVPGSSLLAEARTDHWGVALPRDRHPWAPVRALAASRAYPREALFRSIVWWVVGEG